ncbi:L domain-like protein [Ramicandelaber brevisporus]|nr:L domain-like protein [Ramicandelaber brevisporus]
MKIDRTSLATVAGVDQDQLATITALDLRNKGIEKVSDFTGCSLSLRRIDLSHNSLKTASSLAKALATLPRPDPSATATADDDDDDDDDSDSDNDHSDSDANEKKKATSKKNDKAKKKPAVVANGVTWLSVSNNQLESISFVSEVSTSIRVFTAMHNSIYKIPREVSMCTSLEALVLNNNKLVRIEHIGSLTNLNTLIVSHNDLESFPALPATLARLAKIQVSGNKLTAFPDLSALPRLCELRLNNNAIKGSLPEWLGECKNLTVLDVANNKIDDWESVKNVVSKMRVIRNLNLRGNPFCEKVPDYKEQLTSGKLSQSLRIVDGQRFMEKQPEKKQQKSDNKKGGKRDYPRKRQRDGEDSGKESKFIKRSKPHQTNADGKPHSRPHSRKPRSKPN